MGMLLLLVNARTSVTVTLFTAPSGRAAELHCIIEWMCRSLRLVTDPHVFSVMMFLPLPVQTLSPCSEASAMVSALA